MSESKTAMIDATTSFTLTLDDVEVQAFPGETLWQVAKRAGETIPHLCFTDAPGSRADGNCRGCSLQAVSARPSPAWWCEVPVPPEPRKPGKVFWNCCWPINLRERAAPIVQAICGKRRINWPLMPARCANVCRLVQSGTSQRFTMSRRGRIRCPTPAVMTPLTLP